MIKNCLICNLEFYKSYHSKKVWAKAKYCSWNCLHRSNEGRIPSSESRVKMSLSKKGITPKNFLEMREKGWKATAGKPSWNKGLKGYLAGEKHYNWQGGITPINFAIRESFEYEEWRKAVFERDGYTCQDCGEVGGKLEADHIKLFSRYPKLRFEVSNGQTLCKDCHKIKTIKDLKANWKNQFKENYTIESLN